MFDKIWQGLHVIVILLVTSDSVINQSCNLSCDVKIRFGNNIS